MPCNYDIGNTCEVATPCNYCGGTGFQNIAGIGYRACQYCITGYKVRHCPNCHGNGCTYCMGTKHSFHTELTTSDYTPVPDTNVRPYAGEVAPRPARIMPRR